MFALGLSDMDTEIEAVRKRYIFYGDAGMKATHTHGHSSFEHSSAEREIASDFGVVL